MAGNTLSAIEPLQRQRTTLQESAGPTSRIALENFTQVLTLSRNWGYYKRNSSRRLAGQREKGSLGIGTIVRCAFGRPISSAAGYRDCSKSGTINSDIP